MLLLAMSGMTNGSPIPDWLPSASEQYSEYTSQCHKHPRAGFWNRGECQHIRRGVINQLDGALGKLCGVGLDEEYCAISARQNKTVSQGGTDETEADCVSGRAIRKS